MAGPRKARIGEALRAELWEVIRREMRDPRLVEGLMSITAVDVSADLKYATVFISVLGDEKAQAGALAALSGAAGVLRNELRQRKSFKSVPELSFRYDEGIARGVRIFDLLEESKRTAAVAGEQPLLDETLG
jgi:ribosome-binding factor A